MDWHWTIILRYQHMGPPLQQFWAKRTILDNMHFILLVLVFPVHSTKIAKIKGLAYGIVKYFWLNVGIAMLLLFGLGAFVGKDVRSVFFCNFLKYIEYLFL